MKKINTKSLYEQVAGTNTVSEASDLGKQLLENLHKLNNVRNPIHESDKGLSNIIEKARQQADLISDDQLEDILRAINKQHGPLALQFIEDVLTDDYPIDPTELSPKEIAALHTLHSLIS